MLVTVCLTYLAIGAVIWALVLAPQGFDDTSHLANVAASVGAILLWPLLVWAMIGGGARVQRCRRRPF